MTYSSTEDIYGFQFDVTGATVTGVAADDNGDAAANGFTVSAGNNTVLGFSFSQDFIPAGSGTLVQLTVSEGTPCLENVVLSDVGGTMCSDDTDACGGSCLDITFGTTSVAGCMDVFGLNYDSSATVSDDSCTYADHIIEAGSMYFDSSDLVIEVGESVQWNNVSGYHDAVADNGEFDLPACSGPCLIGSHTFTEAGIYDYICSVCLLYTSPSPRD